MISKSFAAKCKELEELESRLGITPEYIHKIGRDLNRYNLTSIIVSMTPEVQKTANELYNWLRENCDKSSFTRSHGLKKTDWFKPRYWIDNGSSSVQIIYSFHHAVSVIFSAGTIKSNNDISGRDSFNRFCAILKAHKIDINDYACSSKEEAIEIKKSIEKPYIGIASKFMLDPVGNKRPFQHAYHLDINSAFMSGVACNYQVLEKPIRFIYNKRKEDPICKQILNLACGFCQSKHTRGMLQLNKEHRFQYALAKISRAALFYTNRYIERKTRALEAAGYIVLAFNTDGIWYWDVKQLGAYHDEEEGISLFQWKTDHADCTIRFKSDGAYEFIEDGKYYPVIRGRTKLDEIKPREEWEWGDIYLEQAGVQRYGFNELEGFYYNDKEDIFDYAKRS